MFWNQILYGEFKFMKITSGSNFHSFFWQERDIGSASLSTFGVAQAVIEIILMLYPLLCVISQIMHEL